MAKKPTIRQWKKKCDKLWAIIVRSIGHCEVCGKTENLNAHHLIGRGNYKYRYDLDNGLCLCVGHHMFNRDISAHASMESIVGLLEWLQDNKPEQYRWFMDNKGKRDSIKPDYPAIFEYLIEMDTTF